MIAACVLAAVLAMQSSTGVPPGAATGSASQAASSTALVGTENAATDAMAALRREIDALGREPASATRDARMALRRTAFDLLFHGGT
ncbi:MAG: hypothetical protein ACKOFI_11300, partial [Phycisphaerales bacterium]